MSVSTIMIGSFNNSLFLFKQRCIFSQIRYHWHRIKIKQIHFFFQFCIFDSFLLRNSLCLRYFFESSFFCCIVCVDCFVETSYLWIGFDFIQASKRDTQAWDKIWNARDESFIMKLRGNFICINPSIKFR